MHGNRGGVEGVGLNDVGARIKISGMNLLDDRRLGQHQQIIIAFEIAWPILETHAPEVFLLQVIALDHGAHRAIQNQDAVGEQSGQFGGAINSHRWDLENGHFSSERGAGCG